MPLPSAPVQPGQPPAQLKPLTQPAQPVPVALAAQKFASELGFLKSMGYDNVELNQYLLEIHNGNVEAVCNWLMEQSK